MSCLAKVILDNNTYIVTVIIANGIITVVTVIGIIVVASSSRSTELLYTDLTLLRA